MNNRAVIRLQGAMIACERTSERCYAMARHGLILVAISLMVVVAAPAQDPAQPFDGGPAEDSSTAVVTNSRSATRLSPGQQIHRPIYLTGSVVLSSGEKPLEPVLIPRVCAPGSCERIDRTGRRLDRGAGTRFHVPELRAKCLILLGVKSQVSPWTQQSSGQRVWVSTISDSFTASWYESRRIYGRQGGRFSFQVGGGTSTVSCDVRVGGLSSDVSQESIPGWGEIDPLDISRMNH